MFARFRSRRRGSAPAEPPLTSPEDQPILDRAAPLTMTSPARLQAVVDAVRYCQRRGIPGALAECGVWRGGSVLAMILALQQLDAQRDIYLYDTFEGMTEPTEDDTSAVDRSGARTVAGRHGGGPRPWSEVFGPGAYGEQAVRDALLETGYPAERLHVVPGPVERTLPAQAPERLALLRLDTDWYESTHHELEHLYPRLERGGVLIVDDYGHWEGARKAVDEYLAAHDQPLLLARTDYTGRMAVKT